MICKILGLFFNTLTADDRYCYLNKDNLTPPIQMQSSETHKKISEYLDQIMNILDEKTTLIGYVFRKLRTEKDVIRKVSKSAGFRRRFHNQHVKKSQIVSKFAQQRL